MASVGKYTIGCYGLQFIDLGGSNMSLLFGCSETVDKHPKVHIYSEASVLNIWENQIHPPPNRMT